MVQEALKAKEGLVKLGINPTVVNIHTIKPIDSKLLIHLAQEHDIIITCEEHNVMGGLGSAVSKDHRITYAKFSCLVYRIHLGKVELPMPFREVWLNCKTYRGNDLKGFRKIMY